MGTQKAAERGDGVTAPASTIEAEARRLSELLRKNDPAGVTEPIALPPSDPEALRAFWGAIGWNRQWPRRRMLYRPERDATTAKIGALLDQLREECPMSPALADDALPRRFRLVHVDNDGIGFTFTDEDDDAVADPPVVSVVFDTGRMSPIAPSYLRWCASELVRHAFSSWRQVRIKTGEGDPFAEIAAPFPVLAPGARQLDDEVWLLPETLPGDLAPGTRRVAFARPEPLVAWLGRAGLPVPNL